MTARDPSTTGTVLGEEMVQEIRRRITSPGSFLPRPTRYDTGIDSEVYETVPAWGALAVAEYVADLLSAAREEGASAAVIAEERRRCPSCEHLIDQHQQDGCWYAVSVGEGGANLVCPCGMSTALATHAVALVSSDSPDPIAAAREQGAAAERERIKALLQRAADGRDEYAAGAPQGQADTLVTEGQAFASAVRLCDDPTAILGLVPSWRWTEDEDRAVRESS